MRLIFIATVNYLAIWIGGITRIVASEMTLDTMLDSICQAKCLKIFKDSTRSSENSVNILKNPYLIQSFCLKETYCKGCMLGCTYSTQPVKNCSNYCKTISDKYQDSCSSSCNFINEKKFNRPGVCPEITRKVFCSYQCKTDSDCFKQGTKCCKSRLCNSTCQLAEYPKHGVPPTPPAPVVRQIINEKNSDQIHFDLDWSRYNISSIEYPVLFVVQIRIGHLNEASNTVYDTWRTLVSTSKSGAIISAIDLETWYQFRLLAFSEHGFRDVGEMTLPITVQYKPTNPVAPKNISEKVTRIINGKISVTLTWQPGDSNSFLPLSNYRITWKRVYELNENNPLVTEYEINIPSTETQYIIENLLPSASYMVKIVSVVVYKDEKYNSSAAVHYISTASIPQQNNLLEPVNINENNVGCACGVSNLLMPVNIDNATIIDGKLAMQIKLKNGIEFDNIFAPYLFRIQWHPVACIESQYNNFAHPVSDSIQTIFVKDYIDHYLTGLRYHCNYRIETELFSQLAKKIIKIWEGCFCTPSCSSHISRIGEYRPPCLNADQPTPLSIHNLRVVLKKSSNKSNTDAEICWNTKSQYHVSSFQIMWGPRLEEPIDESMYGKDFLPLLDTGKALSKVINYPIQKYTLKDLSDGKIYIVKIQAIDKYSVSQESSIFFKIHPDKNSTHNQRCINYFLLFLLFFIVVYFV